MRDDLIVGLLLIDLLPRKLFLEIFEGKVDRNALRQIFLILEKKLSKVFGPAAAYIVGEYLRALRDLLPVISPDLRKTASEV